MLITGKGFDETISSLHNMHGNTKYMYTTRVIKKIKNIFKKSIVDHF